MLKTIALLSRRPDLTPEAFRAYYEATHAPLAARHIAFRKYVRNHVLAVQHGTVPGDVLCEFWQDDVARALAVLAGPAGAELQADKARCQDLPRQASGEAEEWLLAGPSRGIDPPGTRRQILLLSAQGGLAPAELLAASDWGGDVAEAAPVARASLDLVRPLGHGPFPAAALLSLWLADGAGPVAWPTPPSALTVTGSALVAVCETATDALSAGVPMPPAPARP